MPLADAAPVGASSQGPRPTTEFPTFVVSAWPDFGTVTAASASASASASPSASEGAGGPASMSRPSQPVPAQQAAPVKVHQPEVRTQPQPTPDSDSDPDDGFAPTRLEAWPCSSEEGSGALNATPGAPDARSVGVGASVEQRRSGVARGLLLAGTAMLVVGALAWFGLRWGGSPDAISPNAKAAAQRLQNGAASAAVTAPAQAIENAAGPAHANPGQSSQPTGTFESSATVVVGAPVPSVAAIAPTPATSVAPVASTVATGGTAAAAKRAAELRAARSAPGPLSLPGRAAPMAPVTAPVSGEINAAPPSPPVVAVKSEPLGPSSPAEVCNARSALARVSCLTEQCAKPQFGQHAQCVRLRQQQQQQQEQDRLYGGS